MSSEGERNEVCPTDNVQNHSFRVELTRLSGVVCRSDTGERGRCLILAEKGEAPRARLAVGQRYTMRCGPIFKLGSRGGAICVDREA